MKRRKFFISTLLAALGSPIASQAATINFVASHQEIKPIQLEVGDTLGISLPDAESNLFAMEFAGWATNENGKPQFVNAHTEVKGDMTLYAVWNGGTTVSRKYYKRITKRNEINDYDQFYLVSADGKHALKRSADEYFTISFNENSYTINAEAEYLGQQKEVSIEGDLIDVTNAVDPFEGCLSYEFYPTTDKYGTYSALLNGVSTTANFAYKKGDDEPYFGRATHRDRDDISYLGYNFQWSLSFSYDGYAKLENEKYGYLYYSETPNKQDRNFILSQSDSANLIAYKYIEEFDTAYVRSLDYFVVSIKQPDSVAYIQAMVGSDFGGANTATYIYEDNNGNSYEEPVIAVLKGNSVSFSYEIDHSFIYLYDVKWHCSEPEAGKEGLINVYGKEMKGYTVTPTSDDTVSLQVSYSPAITVIGNKEVAYAGEKDVVDVLGDGSIIMDGLGLSLKNAEVLGGIKLPFEESWLSIEGGNSINGSLVTSGSYLSIYSDNPSPYLSIVGGIKCANEEEGTMLSLNLPITITADEPSLSVKPSPSPLSSVISGFSSFEYDEENLEIAVPKGGYYSESRKMFVDADGNPATAFVLRSKSDSSIIVPVTIYAANGTKMTIASFNVAHKFTPSENELLVCDDVAGKDIQGDNVIYKEKGVYKCNKLVLEDAFGFYSPIAFSASEVVYDRVANKDTMTIIFPCDVPSSKVNGDVFALSNFDGKSLKYKKVTDGLKANTPYLVYKQRGEDKSDALIGTLTDVEVKATTNLNEVIDETGNAAQFGSYGNEVYTVSSDFDYYALQGGKFKKSTIDLQMSSFRAGIKLQKENKGLKAATGFVLDIILDEVTGVENFNAVAEINGRVNVYDVLGRAIRLNIEAEGCLNGLKNGVYFVNGKKVIVKND